METAEIDGSEDQDEVGGVWIVGGVDEQSTYPVPKLNEDEKGTMDAKEFLEERRRLRRARPSGAAGEVSRGGCGCPPGLHGLHGCGGTKRISEQWAHKSNLIKLEPKNLREDGVRKSVGRQTEMAASNQGKSLKWRPVVSNRFATLAEEDVEEDEVHTINAVVEETVEVTVDSGASRSVWPMAKKGARRSPLKKQVKLAAANGTEIAVRGEAELVFDQLGKRCSMGFLDADVKRPLASVSAIVDQGNRVVFGPDACYVEHVATGQRMPMARKKGVFVLELKAITGDKAKTRRKGKMAMDIEEVDEEEDEAVEDELETVEEVGDGLWFRKMKNPAEQGFSRQA